VCGADVRPRGRVVLIDLASSSIPKGAALIEPAKCVPELYQR
jgi:hypothetical protein